MAPIDVVHVLAPDPLFRDMARLRGISDHVGSHWPEYHLAPADPFAAFSLLLQTHALAFWRTELPGWSTALPRISALAQGLAASGELIAFATDATPLDEVLEALWTRLGPAVLDVAELWRVSA
jgi:hypothetical protein